MNATAAQSSRYTLVSKRAALKARHDIDDRQRPTRFRPTRYHEIIPEKKPAAADGCRYNDERLRTAAIRAKAPFTLATLD